MVGLFRKIASISTVGMTDFRSDEERLARKPRVREPRRGVPRSRAVRKVVLPGQRLFLSLGARSDAMG